MSGNMIIEIHKQKWKNHVGRMSEERWPKIAWTYKPIKQVGRKNGGKKILRLVQALSYISHKD